MLAVFNQISYHEALPGGSSFFYLFSFALAFLTAFVVTPALGRLSRSYGVFLDQPDDRRIHHESVPRCGGIAVFLGFNLACSILLLLLPGFRSLGGTLSLEQWYDYLVGATALLLIGLYDDAFDLAWPLKLLGQLLVALFMFSVGVSVNSVLNVELGEWLNLLLTVGWFLAIINAFNLIDGLDGLASGLAVFGAVGLAAIMFYNRSPADAVLMTAFVAACLGFLYYNFHPARIFLGDSGSMFLGFTLATIGLSTGHKTTVVTALGVPLLAMGVPLFDTALAIWRRSVRRALARLGVEAGGSSIVGADLDHIHHRLGQAGWTQRKVALVLYFASAVLVALGIVSLVFNSVAGGIFFLAFIAGSFVVARHVAQIELWDSGRLIVEGLRRPAGRALPAILYPLIDFIFFACALIITLVLTASSLSWSDLKAQFLFYHPLWCAAGFLSLVFSGAYNKVWSRARVSEFVFIGLALLISSSFSMGVELVVFDITAREGVVKALLFFCTSTFFIVGVRIFPRAVFDLMSLRVSQGRGPQLEQERVLIYGAGIGYKQYLDGANGSTAGMAAQRIIGLIDDQINLRKRFISGYQVLGCGDEIASCIAKHKIDRVVLTCVLPRPQLDWLVSCCQEHSVDLDFFTTRQDRLYCALSQQVTLEAAIEVSDTGGLKGQIFAEMPQDRQSASASSEDIAH